MNYRESPCHTDVHSRRLRELMSHNYDSVLQSILPVLQGSILMAVFHTYTVLFWDAKHNKIATLVFDSHKT